MILPFCKSPPGGKVTLAGEHQPAYSYLHIDHIPQRLFRLLSPPSRSLSVPLLIFRNHFPPPPPVPWPSFAPSLSWFRCRSMIWLSYQLQNSHHIFIEFVQIKIGAKNWGMQNHPWLTWAPKTVRCRLDSCSCRLQDFHKPKLTSIILKNSRFPKN